jgi:exodeoxyribonuclease V alpha subunit
VSGPLPTGAATRRFLALRGGAPDGPEPWAVDVDDFEPHYVGWEIARCATGLGAEDARALAALVAACVAATRAGSTRLPWVGPAFTRALAAIGASGMRDAATALVRRAHSADASDPVRSVLGVAGERKPILVDGDWLYTERMRVLEERLCDRIRRRVRGRPAMAAGDARAESRAAGRALAATAGRSSLTAEQQAAVREALSAPLTLITGGPGTGKTTTVVALVRSVAWRGVPPLDTVAIAAPTGKAAQRLGDAIAAALAAPTGDIADAALGAMVPSPTTLHRLLGWSPSSGRFARHENDPLPHRLVIIDEASMIDLAMMDRLVAALRPEANLVLLGDADQLPSVEAGAVFRDLCAALPTRRLTANMRVARDPNAMRILAVAQAVNSGNLDVRFDEAVTGRGAAADVAFEGVEHLDRPWTEEGDALVERWVSERMGAEGPFAECAQRTYRLRDGELEAADRSALQSLFTMHLRSRVLCVTRVLGSTTSAAAINAQVSDRRRAVRGRGPAWRHARDLEPGTPVLVQRNDYARGLFNGDQGVVVRVDTGDGAAPRRMAVFPRGASFEAFAIDAVADLTPAYAMTVHKAQGSEFDDVTLVLPDEDLPLLTRELVYTAITRARRSVLFVGKRELLERAVARTVERSSGVAERLRNS